MISSYGKSLSVFEDHFTQGKVTLDIKVNRTKYFLNMFWPMSFFLSLYRLPMDSSNFTIVIPQYLAFLRIEKTDR